MSEQKSESGNGDARPSVEGPPRKGPAPNSSAHITRPTTMAPSASYASINQKPKANPEGSVQSMTVETETVSSVPQVALSGGTGERGGAGRAEPGGERTTAAQRGDVETSKGQEEDDAQGPVARSRYW